MSLREFTIVDSPRYLTNVNECLIPILQHLFEDNHLNARLSFCELYLSLNVGKPVFGVSDQVRHKPACAVTEEG